MYLFLYLLIGHLAYYFSPGKAELDATGSIYMCIYLSIIVHLFICLLYLHIFRDASKCSESETWYFCLNYIVPQTVLSFN